MPTTLTQSDLVPPDVPPLVATEWPENLRDIGDRIAALDSNESAELMYYLNSVHGVGLRNIGEKISTYLVEKYFL